MPQDKGGHVPHVVHGHVHFSLQGRPRFRPEHEVLHGPRPDPPRDVVAGETRRGRVRRPRGLAELDAVHRHVIAHGHHGDHLLERQDLRGGEHFPDPRVETVPRHALRDGQLVGDIGIVDLQHEHEPVKLGFGQGIGPFLLDGVLRGQHEERFWKIIGPASAGDLAFLHGLEQGGLRFRRRPVDLVRQQDVREDRPPDEPELSLSALGILVDDLGTGDVRRHQVRRELDPVEFEIDRLRNRLHHERLRQARHTHHEAVTPRKHGRQQVVHHLLLAHDYLGDFFRQRPAHTPDAINGLRVKFHCLLCRLCLVVHSSLSFCSRCSPVAARHSLALHHAGGGSSWRARLRRAVPTGSARSRERSAPASWPTRCHTHWRRGHARLSASRECHFSNTR